MARSTLWPAFVGAVALASCSGSNGGTPSSILTDPAVQSALGGLASQNNNITVGTSRCVDAAQWFASYRTPGYLDSAAAGQGPTPPNVVGTWNWTDCYSTDANTFPTLSPCSGSITWSNEGGGQITQSNVGGVSQGTGTIGTVASLPEKVGSPGVAIVQTNHAMGAGCSQDVVNLIQMNPVSQPNQWNSRYDVVVIDVIKSSTCGGPSWKCSTAYMTQ